MSEQLILIAARMKNVLSAAIHQLEGLQRKQALEAIQEWDAVSLRIGIDRPSPVILLTDDLFDSPKVEPVSARPKVEPKVEPKVLRAGPKGHSRVRGSITPETQKRLEDISRVLMNGPMNCKHIADTIGVSYADTRIILIKGQERKLYTQLFDRKWALREVLSPIKVIT